MPPKPEPPAQPKFNPETREVIARLVADGRVDLIEKVMARTISPFQASLLAGHGRRRRTPAAEAAKPEAKKEPPFDPRVLIP